MLIERVYWLMRGELALYGKKLFSQKYFKYEDINLKNQFKTYQNRRVTNFANQDEETIKVTKNKFYYDSSI